MVHQKTRYKYSSDPKKLFTLVGELPLTKVSKSESRMLSLILVPILLIARKKSMLAFT